MDGVMGFTTLFVGNFAPKNWAFCNGQPIAIQQNAALFSILGTTYGGDGTRTFNLPNLEGRAVVGVGQGPGLSNYSPGDTGGSSVSTILGTQMPAHTHPITVQLTSPTNGTVNSTSPENAYYATGTNSIYNYTENDKMQAFTGNLTLANTGYNVLNAPPPIPTLHPTLAINYIICLTGLFPQRQ